MKKLGLLLLSWSKLIFRMGTWFGLNGLEAATTEEAVGTAHDVSGAVSPVLSEVSSVSRTPSIVSLNSNSSTWTPLTHKQLGGLAMVHGPGWRDLLRIR